ncbi:MAG: hypothetical protein ABI847_16465 [Anaerolineales bacterium]
MSDPITVPAATPRPPLTVWLFMVLSWILGWWLGFDGLHQRLFGDYIRIGGQLGPWAGLARTVGVDPFSLSFAFVAFGLGLIGATFGVFLRRRWGFYTSLLFLACMLLYLGFGMPVAAVCIILLLLPATRAYLDPPLG